MSRADALSALREALAGNAPYLALRNAAAALVVALDEESAERAEAEPARVMTLRLYGEVTRTTRTGSTYPEIVHVQETTHANNPNAKRAAKRVLENSPSLANLRAFYGDALGLRWETRL